MGNKSSSKKSGNRLKPTSKTVRELYLLSGNRCAFPGCPEAIISNTGVLQGEIAHIEAAEKGGSRFNSSQTDEQKENVTTEYMLLAIAFDMNKLHYRIQSHRTGQFLFPVKDTA